MVVNEWNVESAVGLKLSSLSNLDQRNDQALKAKLQLAFALSSLALSSTSYHRQLSVDDNSVCVFFFSIEIETIDVGSLEGMLSGLKILLCPIC